MFCILIVRSYNLNVFRFVVGCCCCVSVVVMVTVVVFGMLLKGVGLVVILGVFCYFLVFVRLVLNIFIVFFKNIFL